MKLGVKVAPDLIATAVESGFNFIEVYTTKKTLQASDIYNKYKNVVYIVDSPPTYFDETVIDFACKINSHLIQCHPNRLSFKRFRDLVNEANKKNIIVCVENGEDRFNTFEEHKKYLDEVPNLKFCVDIEHAYSTNNFPKIFELTEKIVHIHISGYNGSELSSHTAPFIDIENVKRAFEKLTEINYQNVVSIEMESIHHTQTLFSSLRYQILRFLEKKR